MNNERLYKILDALSYGFLLFSALFVPLFLDKNLSNFFIIPKQYVFIGFTLAAFLLFAVKITVSKVVSFKRTILDLPILLFLGAGLVSAVFSGNIYDSFFGRNEYFVFSFVFMFFCALYYFLLVNYTNTLARWRGIFDAIIIAGGISALIFIVRQIFSFDLLAKMGVSVWNTVDGVNSQFGFWLVAVFVLAAGALIKKELSVGRSLLYFFVAILAFTTLTLLSFNLLWWVLMIGLALLLLLGMSFVREARMGWISVLFAVLVMVAVFIFFGTPRSFQTAVPMEVALGSRPSWSIAYNAMLSGAKPFLIGTGLGTFGADFSKFRPADFNYDANAWSLRFNQPFNTFFSFISEGGIALALVLVFLVLFVLGHAFTAWRHTRLGRGLRGLNMTATDAGALGSFSLDVFLLLAVWMLLTVGMAFTFYGPVLWWLWWTALALAIIGMSFVGGDLMKSKEWAIEDTPQYSLSFSFVLIIVMAAAVLLGVWGARLYLAEMSYAKALTSTDYTEAETRLRESVLQRRSSDTYNAALAQVLLLKAVNESRAQNPDMQKVSAYVADAVNAARAATDISPRSVALWENLATMYENAAALVPEARDWAIKALLSAKELEPTNPVLWWRLGNSYSFAGRWDDAVKTYEQAIALKADYLGSYSGLANAYEQKNNIEKAVETYRQVMPYAAQNPDALFNYGRLLYNRNKKGDRDDAEKLWLEAVRVQPNYSNALYSLGLMYENRGDKATALQYYYKVKDLNPDNKDIAAKIRTLVGQ